MIEELIDRFGDPNRPVMNLIEIASLKSLCSKIGVDYVTTKGDELWMRFSMAADIDLMGVLLAIKKHPDCLRMQGGNPPTLVYFKRGKAPEELLRGATEKMQIVVSDYLSGEENEGNG